MALGETHDIFVDKSIDTGDIPEGWDDEQIRTAIRDRYLRDSTVTIVLVGTDTKRRKHVDWEIHSSMYDGKVNKKSGILVVNLPPVSPDILGHGAVMAPHDGEKTAVYPDLSGWGSIGSRQKLADRYPHMPDRLLDNINKASISVTTWRRIQDPNRLKFLINAAFTDRKSCEYDTSRPMKRRNS